MADVPGYYHPVWFHPGGIANILSLVNMIAKYHVTYDSRNGDTPNTFCVLKENGEKRMFKQSRRGLYYLDTADTSSHVVLVSTVEEKKSNYTERYYYCAKLAHKTQILIGRPELRDYLQYIANNDIPNCPVGRQDVLNAADVFGCDFDTLQGKTTRRKLEGTCGSILNIPR
jgi:hypothetical protein